MKVLLFLFVIGFYAALLIFPIFIACDSGNHNDDDKDQSDDDDSASDDDDNDDDTFNEGDWKDEATNFFWQIESYPMKLNWFDALKYCEGLSQKGQHDWRLPSISELRSLIRGCDKTETEGECGITDECLSQGDECYNSSCTGCERKKSRSGRWMLLAFSPRRKLLDVLVFIIC